MIDGQLPSDHRSPRSGSKEHAAVNSAAADRRTDRRLSKPYGSKAVQQGARLQMKGQGADGRQNRRASVRRHATALVLISLFGYIMLAELWSAPIFSTDPDAATRVWSVRESEPVADGQGPGDRRSMIDGQLPSDHRSPRSGSKEHAAVNSAAADE
jgi:hypothetical protein